jgi:hypothetical protein
MQQHETGDVISIVSMFLSYLYLEATAWENEWYSGEVDGRSVVLKVWG